MTTQQTNWTKYTGNDEQIAELENAQYGVLLGDMDEILDVSDMTKYINVGNAMYKPICKHCGARNE